MLFFSELKEGENRPCAPLANVGQRVRSLTIAPGILDEFARVALISDSPSTFVVSKEHISLDHPNLFQLGTEGTGEEEGRFDGERERGKVVEAWERGDCDFTNDREQVDRWRDEFEFCGSIYRVVFARVSK